MVLDFFLDDFLFAFLYCALESASGKIKQKKYRIEWHFVLISVLVDLYLIVYKSGTIIFLLVIPC